MDNQAGRAAAKAMLLLAMIACATAFLAPASASAAPAASGSADHESVGAATAVPVGPNFGAQARAAGLTAAQAQNLQRRVDTVLAGIPGGLQVSATEVRYDGLTVTVDPRWSAGAVSPASISCADGWFCIRVNGYNFAFYTCQTWSLSNWLGWAPFNNQQTRGTLARAYDLDHSLVWQSYAPKSGSVNVDEWWYFQPC